jgi:hypothetical protein
LAAEGRCRKGRGKWPRPFLSCLLPALDQLVVRDGLGSLILVLELRIRCARLFQPVGRVLRLVHLRTDVALNACAFQAFHDLLLRFAETVEGFLGGLGAGHGVTDVLPPQLRQLRIVRNVGAGRRPLDARRRAVELDQAAKLGGTLGEVIRVDGRLTDEGETDIGFLQIDRLGGDELGVEPGGLCTIDRGRLHQRPGTSILIADLLPSFQ